MNAGTVHRIDTGLYIQEEEGTTHYTVHDEHGLIHIYGPELPYLIKVLEELRDRA